MIFSVLILINVQSNLLVLLATHVKGVITSYFMGKLIFESCKMSDLLGSTCVKWTSLQLSQGNQKQKKTLLQGFLGFFHHWFQRFSEVFCIDFQPLLNFERFNFKNGWTTHITIRHRQRHINYEKMYTNFHHCKF